MVSRWKTMLALSALGLLTIAQIAGATHPRPKGATPLRVSLAVAYKQCPATAPPANRQHGAPLAVLSCSSTPQQLQQASSYLTVGTGDAWTGTLSKSTGAVRFDVKATSPEDVKIVASVTDTRCVGNSASGFCGNANTDNAGVPDYSGELNGSVTARVTDHFSGPIGSCGACSDPATASDVTLAIGTPCANTPDTSIGSICSINTTANSIILGAVQDNKRASLEAQTINVQDGGGDGTAATTFDNTLFETQGIFIP